MTRRVVSGAERGISRFWSGFGQEVDPVNPKHLFYQLLMENE
ncbi:MAG: hypothetical protein NTY63_04165 [Candidatus Bipolaricaulota bacterium]|nr:hypothetical protein [Candidatus Bipolaricaulota bacterium]